MAGIGSTGIQILIRSERMMLPEKYSCFCDAKTHDPLLLIQERDSRGATIHSLINHRTNVRYSIVDGIVRILNEQDVIGRNKRYQGLYDSFAPFYSFAQKLVPLYYRMMRLFRKNVEEDPFRGFITKLGVKPGEKVLEVSIGTGDNVHFLPKGIALYGLDISLGMLKQCYKRYRKSSPSPILVHGMAEELPFKDATFDVILHIGGINFFTNKAQAIQEMIRVAKPGARFIIADETEKAAKESESMIIARRFFKNRDEVIVPPVDLIPKEMKNIELNYRFDESLYIITFTKP
jgi:ubiquinone/menaquinone biosynthesis C-methylase UbiE